MVFIGNKKAVSILEKYLDKGICAQSWLFCGPENVGKFKLAKFFGHSLIEGKNDLVFEGKNVDEKLPLDLLIVEPEIEDKKGIVKEKDIKIENIREAQKNLALFPYQGKYKVLIINNAHRMTEEAQNALLKLLEEPNPTSIIILVSHEENKILSTIHSRCQKISFDLVKDVEMSEFLGARVDKIADLAMGKPGLAIKLRENNDELEFRMEARKDFQNLAKMGINQRLKLAEIYSKNIPQTIVKLELWMWLLREKAGGSTDSSVVVKIYKIIERIENSLWESKNTNANSRLILENLFLSL